MLFVDLIEETFFAVLANKVRSSLTVLGIVIGIGSVVAMISIGQGATSEVSKNIQALGSNLLVVMPGSQMGVGMQVRGGMGSASSLILEDAEAIAEQVSDVVAVAPEVSTRKQVIVKGENTNTSNYGVTNSYTEVKNIEIETGSFISDQNIAKSSKIAVLGPDTKDDLFGENVNPIGQTVKIENMNFTVVGVTKSKGGTGFGSSDDLIYIPLSTAQHYFTGSNSVSNINIQVKEEELMVSAEEQITNLLLTRHSITDPINADFSIMNQADILDTMSDVSGTLTLLLGAIAGISLVVGGIGIMNMMLTTVTERTREIGLRKSLGAKNKNIALQFLMESVTLTFIGGIIGIMLGWLASMLVTKFSGTTTVVSAWSIFLAFGVSAAIGIIFGYYPAKRAASLNPIEALRYE